MSRHTPGPWKLEERSTDGRSWGYVYPVNAETLPGGSRPPAVARLCHTAKQKISEVEANGRLIAASPRLLEVLKTIANGLTDGDSYMERLLHAEQLARDAVFLVERGAE